jgi:chromosomal replication initiation ATPase DnaA
MSTEEIFMESPITARYYVVLTMPEKIIREVSKYFNISIKDIKGTSQKQEIIKARHHAIFFIWKHTDMTQTQIISYFKGKGEGDQKKKNRTLVNYIYNKIRDGVETYDNAKADFLALSGLIESAIHS